VQLAAMVAAVFVLQHELGLVDGMLTWDAQRLLARYREAIVDFEEHLAQVRAKV
jgi:hypothetical protein